MVALRYVTQIWSCNYITDSQEKTKDVEERKRKKEKKKRTGIQIPFHLIFCKQAKIFELANELAECTRVAKTQNEGKPQAPRLQLRGNHLA